MVQIEEANAGIAIATARIDDEDMDHFPPQKSDRIKRIGYRYKVIFYLAVFLLFISCSDSPDHPIIDPTYFKHYVDDFNQKDQELYINYVPNNSAYDFLARNIPVIEIPDKTIEETYYFRWWTYRKHIKNTPDGFVITEFLPDVPWSGEYNTISCAASHHIYEGRWLRDPEYVNDYLEYWLTKAEFKKRKYSFWLANAANAHRSVHPYDSLLSSQLPYFVKFYYQWEKSRKDPGRSLFWQFDAFDGMEFSASGRFLNGGESKMRVPAIRPTLNSYMYGDAMAIKTMARSAGNPEIENLFSAKAVTIKSKLQDLLWNKKLHFFTVLPRNFSDNNSPVNIRELIGYTPWYFNLPDDRPEYASAWDWVMDTSGFSAPFGLTTCERSHPYFQVDYSGWECQWNGPVWPYATTVTVKALANFLNNYTAKGKMTNEVFYDLLFQYANSQFLIKNTGDKVKWIDESQNPFTGDWITRTRLKNWEGGAWPKKLGGLERGKDYNHSGFCDLVLSDLLGIRPQSDGTLEINPLIPESWDWYCIDHLLIQEKNISILWDRTGQKYNRGKGFMVFVDGELAAKSDIIEKLTIGNLK